MGKRCIIFIQVLSNRSEQPVGNRFVQCVGMLNNSFKKNSCFFFITQLRGIVCTQAILCLVFFCQFIGQCAGKAVLIPSIK
jgi:hypothetical protein